jgi:hypothetical protein
MWEDGSISTFLLRDDGRCGAPDVTSIFDLDPVNTSRWPFTVLNAVKREMGSSGRRHL